MATIEDRLKREMEDFKLALADKYEIDGVTQLYSPIQKKFIKDSISSLDYVLSVLEGKRKMPRKDEDEKSSKGKVFGYLWGSIVNITMSESFLYGKWGNIADCFNDSFTGFEEDMDPSCASVMSDRVHAKNNEEDMDSYMHRQTAETDGYDRSVFKLANELNFVSSADEKNKSSENIESDEDDEYEFYHCRGDHGDCYDLDEGLCDCYDC